MWRGDRVRNGIKLNSTECWDGQWKTRLETLMNGAFASKICQWTTKTCIFSSIPGWGWIATRVLLCKNHPGSPSIQREASRMGREALTPLKAAGEPLAAVMSLKKCLWAGTGAGTSSRGARAVGRAWQGRTWLLPWDTGGKQRQGGERVLWAKVCWHENSIP